MQFVEIYELKNDGSQGVIAVCKLLNNEAICEGEKSFIENLKQRGVLDYSDSSKSPAQKIFPKDGLRFLEQLKYNFKSGYLNASDIKES